MFTVTTLLWPTRIISLQWCQSDSQTGMKYSPLRELISSLCWLKTSIILFSLSYISVVQLYWHPAHLEIKTGKIIRFHKKKSSSHYTLVTVVTMKFWSLFLPFFPPKQQPTKPSPTTNSENAWQIIQLNTSHKRVSKPALSCNRCACSNSSQQQCLWFWMKQSSLRLAPTQSWHAAAARSCEPHVGTPGSWGSHQTPNNRQNSHAKWDLTCIPQTSGEKHFPCMRACCKEANYRHKATIYLGANRLTCNGLFLVALCNSVLTSQKYRSCWGFSPLQDPLDQSCLWIRFVAWSLLDWGRDWQIILQLQTSTIHHSSW